MLAYGEDIAIGILEPGYLAAVGSGPDTEILVLREGIFLRGDAVVPEPGGDGFDVFDLPSEDGALQWREIRDFCNSQAVPTDAHHQRVLIEAHKLEFQFTFIEGPRLVVILCGNKQLGTTLARYLEGEIDQNDRLAG